MLRIIKKELVRKGVTIHTKHSFVGFSKNIRPIVENHNELTELNADHFIFALGGASWSVTGSDGKWTSEFEKLNVQIHPFQAANCGVNVKWPEHIRQFHLGKPLKNIAIRFEEKSQKGEALISEYGLEGNAIYPLASTIGKHLNSHPTATLWLDFKPMMTPTQIVAKIQNSQSINFVKKLNLSSEVIALVKWISLREEWQNHEKFAHLLKNLPLPISSLRPIDEAISTTGGISIQELNSDFSLKKYPHISCIGEMVDWDAPTGGYLLQACFSMAFHKAHSLLSKENTILQNP